MARRRRRSRGSRRPPRVRGAHGTGREDAARVRVRSTRVPSRGRGRFSSRPRGHEARRGEDLIDGGVEASRRTRRRRRREPSFPAWELAPARGAPRRPVRAQRRRARRRGRPRDAPDRREHGRQVDAPSPGGDGGDHGAPRVSRACVRGAAPPGGRGGVSLRRGGRRRRRRLDVPRGDVGRRVRVANEHASIALRRGRAREGHERRRRVRARARDARGHRAEGDEVPLRYALPPPRGGCENDRVRPARRRRGVALIRRDDGRRRRAAATGARGRSVSRARSRQGPRRWAPAR